MADALMEVTRDDWWANGKEGAGVDKGSCGWWAGDRRNRCRRGREHVLGLPGGARNAA